MSPRQTPPPTYEARCDVTNCPWTGGNYSNERDRDNAVTMHKNVAHKE